MFSEIDCAQHFFAIDEIKALVADEFNAVDNLILSHLHSNIPMIEEISRHILHSGGKRLRPLLLLLLVKAFNYQGSDHIPLAAVLEFLHTATLLHDDVVDNSTLRRGQQTANTIWGNAPSVLVGDFLYSRTFEMLTHLNNIEVMKILAKTTNAIAEGEVLQLLKRNDPQLTEKEYMEIIANKTARLFQAASEVASLVSDCSTQQQAQMSKFGLHLGITFQLIDDVLDYAGNREMLGKNIGDDLAEGKVTLPLIHALQHAGPQATLIEETIRTGGAMDLDMIIEVMHTARSLDYTLSKAKQQREEALAALSCLPDSKYRSALKGLTSFALNRNH